MQIDVMQIIVNGEPREIAPQLTIAALLRELRLDPRRVAVEVNRLLVPREEHEQVSVSPGDKLEVVTLVGGG